MGFGMRQREIGNAKSGHDDTNRGIGVKLGVDERAIKVKQQCVLAT